MSRARLRIYLGVAPGVGKTYAMLNEGWRRRERGTDVVVGYVEPFGRSQTLAQLRDLEVIPRHLIHRRGHSSEQMDIDAVLARKPAVVLIDQLAHTNSPGSRHRKRWQDAEELLEAGIEVVSTVNIDQLESLKDVVHRITGVTQRETIPDDVVRSAEQIELVDMSPEALRRRLAHGNIYPHDKVDAALNGYFRTGNLGALRVLALLWMADRVEEDLYDHSTRPGNLRSASRPGARHHPTVMVAVDEVTQGVITAIEYGRLLRPERLQGLHIDTDEEITLGLAQEWYRHFRARVPLVVVDPSGRSVADSCARTILEYMPAPEHPVVMIIPRRWQKGSQPFDDQDPADDIAATLASLENVYVLFAPDFGA